jgi:hypothetical protein
MREVSVGLPSKQTRMFLYIVRLQYYYLFVKSLPISLFQREGKFENTLYKGESVFEKE